MRCARSSPTRCRSSVELTRSVNSSVTGALMSLLSPPLGTCARLIHLRQTRREADRRDERPFPAKAYGTRPSRTLAERQVKNLDRHLPIFGGATDRPGAAVAVESSPDGRELVLRDVPIGDEQITV